MFMYKFVFSYFGLALSKVCLELSVLKFITYQMKLSHQNTEKHARADGGWTWPLRTLCK